MSLLSGLKAGLSAVVAGTKACFGIHDTLAAPVSEEDSRAYNEFFDADMGTTWPDEVTNVEPRGLRMDRKIPTIDNAKHEYSTTASRREAQRKLDAKRMVHVSVPVTEQDQLAAGWFGDRVWNYRIRASGTTYYKSVVR